MNGRTLLYLVIALLLGVTSMARAALRIDVGRHTVPAGSNLWQIPIQITGGDLVTDMAGAVQLGWDGGTLVGGEPGPVIKAVSYTGSIWAGAPGGFDAFSTIAAGNQLLDPNVSLRVGDQKVAGQGLLLTLTIDVTGYSPGLYELRLAQVQGMATTFQNAGVEVPVTIANGVIAVGTTIPASPPRLSVVAVAGGRARLNLPSEAGRRYRVQWAGEANGVWAEVPVDLIGTGSEVSWIDDGTATGQAPGSTDRRFYRIRITQ